MSSAHRPPPTASTTPPPALPRRSRVRRAVNLVTLATPLGRLLARRAGIAVTPGPHGLLLARGYPRRFPAPRASAVTVGDVVLLRVDDAPDLLRHEARHAGQWACWLGPLGFLPAYLAASGWSWLRTRHPALGNPFEIRAGLQDGGYRPPAARGSGNVPGRIRARSRRPGRR